MDSAKLDPLGDGISVVELVDHMGTDASVVRAARVSFANENEAHDPERDAKLIRYLADNRHGTPFEHTSVTFHVAAPIFVVRQWHRHRMFSYNEVSRRYTSEEIRFYAPGDQGWRAQAEKNRQASEGRAGDSVQAQLIYEEQVRYAKKAYHDMLDCGVAREQARMVLPQSLYTRMYVTGNLRSYAHFHGLRADEHAQPEIRVYAEAMGEILAEIFPVSWAALTEGGR